MALLCAAEAIVRLVPLRLWRASIGRAVAPTPMGAAPIASARACTASGIAADIERGAGRLPVPARCLARAMVLCWQLRLCGIACCCKIAARPGANRAGHRDALHAWVEVEDAVVLGAMPGPWIVVLALAG